MNNTANRQTLAPRQPGLAQVPGPVLRVKLSGCENCRRRRGVCDGTHSTCLKRSPYETRANRAISTTTVNFSPSPSAMPLLCPGGSTAPKATSSKLATNKVEARMAAPVQDKPSRRADNEQDTNNLHRERRPASILTVEDSSDEMEIETIPAKFKLQVCFNEIVRIVEASAEEEKQGLRKDLEKAEERCRTGLQRAGEQHMAALQQAKDNHQAQINAVREQHEKHMDRLTATNLQLEKDIGLARKNVTDTAEHLQNEIEMLRQQLANSYEKGRTLEVNNQQLAQRQKQYQAIFKTLSETAEFSGWRKQFGFSSPEPFCNEMKTIHHELSL